MLKFAEATSKKLRYNSTASDRVGELSLDNLSGCSPSDSLNQAAPN
jgi:hypothetical protein